MQDPSLIRVRTEVVLDVLVSSLHEAARARAEGEGLALLRALGWHARALERERFGPAREPMPWLAEMLAGRSAEELSEALAAEEPLGRADPGSAPSWRVPGPGGHVRHYLAMRAVAEAGVEDELAAKRAWMAGFFAHCCEEAVS